MEHPDKFFCIISHRDREVDIGIFDREYMWTVVVVQVHGFYVLVVDLKNKDTFEFFKKYLVSDKMKEN